MRVLYATDGSSQAELAAELLTSIHWPAGSRARILSAVDVSSTFGVPLGPAILANADLQDQAIAEEARSVVDEAARLIARSGLEYECSTIAGRPATVVVDEARDWQADLIVMGSRGHGAIASMVLGSVSAEVVDHAPCPVLVARRPRLTRAVLGQDGSDCALAAETIIATWPIFERVAIDVVAVAPMSPSWPPAMYAGNIGTYIEAPTPSVDDERPIAESSARRLRLAGRNVSTDVVEGAPATELIRIARDRSADMIVTGTHGRTGLSRLLLGSVARNVLNHADCSVLIVR